MLVTVTISVRGSPHISSSSITHLAISRAADNWYHLRRRDSHTNTRALTRASTELKFCLCFTIFVYEKLVFT